MQQYPVQGAGVGLRRVFLDDALALPEEQVAFWEIAPENWLGVGGAYARKLWKLTERKPFVCHGLSLSVGGPDPLDEVFLQGIKGFSGSTPDRYLHRAPLLQRCRRSPL